MNNPALVEDVVLPNVGEEGQQEKEDRQGREGEYVHQQGHDRKVRQAYGGVK